MPGSFNSVQLICTFSIFLRLMPVSGLTASQHLSHGKSYFSRPIPYTISWLDTAIINISSTHTLLLLGEAVPSPMKVAFPKEAPLCLHWMEVNGKQILPILISLMCDHTLKTDQAPPQLACVTKHYVNASLFWLVAGHILFWVYPMASGGISVRAQWEWPLEIEHLLKGSRLIHLWSVWQCQATWLINI